MKDESFFEDLSLVVFEDWVKDVERRGGDIAVTRQISIGLLGPLYIGFQGGEDNIVHGGGGSRCESFFEWLEYELKYEYFKFYTP